MPNMDALKGWKQYFGIAIPATMMLCSEWWFFELLMLTAGGLGVKEQATMVVMLNLLGFMWMLPMGFQEALCTVVGNCIGENKPELARKYLKVTTGIALSIITAWTGAFFFFRQPVANIYVVVKDDDTQKLNEMLVKGVKILALIFIPDAAQGYL